MPDKPVAQLIRELSVQVAEVIATSRAWAEYGQRDISRLDSADTSTNESLQELARKVAVFEQKVDDLRSGWLELARRLWAVLGPVIGG